MRNAEVMGVGEAQVEQDWRENFSALAARRIIRLGLRRGYFMRSFTAVVERDAETGLYVGYVPGFAGAGKGATLDELRDNLGEVVSMLLEDDLTKPEESFVGTQTILVK